MARKFGPFDTSQFYEVENRRMQRGFNDATGFIRTGQGAVTAGTGAQLIIAAYPDGAMIDGLYVENPTTETVTLTTNSGNTNPRIDRLVLRLDMAAKTIAPFQIVGTPAASPAVPPLVKTDTVYDMPLCRYTMPGSASAQNPGSIVDERVYAGTVGNVFALSPAASFSAEPADGYGAPQARLGPGGRVDLSGMIRNLSTTTANALAGELVQFTLALPQVVRPGGPRVLGVASTTSGPADIYYKTDTFNLAFSYRATTSVYGPVNWFVNLNSLFYYL